MSENGNEQQAQECFNEALHLAADGSAVEQQIYLLGRALELGLTKYDEMQARAFLGSAFIEKERISEGINELDIALKLDATHSFGFFDQELFRKTFFPQLSAAYVKEARTMIEDRGEAAISYLGEKLRRVDHLPRVQMSMVHLELGVIHRRRGQYDLAAKHFHNVLEAEILHEDEVQFVELAEGNLRMLGL